MSHDIQGFLIAIGMLGVELGVTSQYRLKQIASVVTGVQSGVTPEQIRSRWQSEDPRHPVTLEDFDVNCLCVLVLMSRLRLPCTPPKRPFKAGRHVSDPLHLSSASAARSANFQRSLKRAGFWFAKS